MHKRTSAEGTKARAVGHEGEEGEKREREGRPWHWCRCWVFYLSQPLALHFVYMLLMQLARFSLWFTPRRLSAWKAHDGRRTDGGQRQRWMTNHRVLQPVKAHSRIHTWVHASLCVCCALSAFCCLVFFAICLFVCLSVCLFVCLSRFCQHIYECQRGFHLLWRPFCPFVRGRLPFVCRMTARSPLCCRCSVFVGPFVCPLLFIMCSLRLFMQPFSLAAPLQRHCHQSAVPVGAGVTAEVAAAVAVAVAFGGGGGVLVTQSSAYFDPH